MSANLEILRALPMEEFEWALPVDPESYFLIESLGTPNEPRVWVPPLFELVAPDNSRRYLRANLPWHSDVSLVLRDETIEVIGPLLEPWGRLLELECDQANLVLFTAPMFSGALNVESSEVVRFSGGDIMAVDRYVFNDDVVRGIGAFRIPELRVSGTFYSAELVDQMVATGLAVGTRFETIFVSEDGPR